MKGGRGNQSPPFADPKNSGWSDKNPKNWNKKNWKHKMQNVGKQIGSWGNKLKKQWKKDLPWEEHHSSKNSVSSVFKAKRKELETELMSLIRDCKTEGATKNSTEMDECNYSNHTLKGERLNRFWEANPKANMLRWEHKTEEFISKVQGFTENIDASNKRLSFLREKLGPMMTNSHPSMKDQHMMKNLRRGIAMMEARQRLVDQYKTWQTQKSKWDNSDIAKCLESRKRKFTDSLLPGVFGSDAEQATAHTQGMSEVWKECEKITNKNLPFANGGCFDKLAESISELSLGFGKLFTSNEGTLGLPSWLEKLQGAIGIVQNQCISPTDKNQTCQEYFKSELEDSDIEEMKNSDGQTSMSVAFKFNGFKDVMKKLMDKEFWLNAPEDCGVQGDEQVNGLVNGMQNEYKNMKNVNAIAPGEFLPHNRM